MNDIKILSICFVYNEMAYLPMKLEWMRREGLDSLYIIDNMSTDGTWEWAQKNNIPSHRLDTNGAFDLDRLNSEVISVLHKIKPDWVIIIDPDTFFITQNGIKKDIEITNNEGYDGIHLDYIAMINTGEESKEFDPFNTYFYAHPVTKTLRQAAKYRSDISLLADDFMPFGKPKKIEGCEINYGNTKGKIRDEVYERRIKAWNNGLNPGYGGHYKTGNSLGWQWEKGDKMDVRDSKYYEYIKTLQDLNKK